jgi:hypothetical protein
MALLKLKLFDKRAASRPAPVAPPRGSFTVDAGGWVVSSTLPRSFPEPVLQEIAHAVLVTFHSAPAAQLRLSEFTAQYAALRITAREMRGGAIVYLAPRGPARK